MATMANHFPDHEQAAADINGKSIVNDGLGDGFDGVNAIHIAVGCVIDQNIHMAETNQGLIEDEVDRGFVGNVTFQNQKIGLHLPQLGFHCNGITGIGGKIAVHTIVTDFGFIKRAGELFVHQNYLCTLPRHGQGGGGTDALGIIGTGNERYTIFQFVINHFLCLPHVYVTNIVAKE